MTEKNMSRGEGLALSLSMLVAGLMGVIFAVFMIASDMRDVYGVPGLTYTGSEENPFTAREWFVLSILLVAFLIFLAGFIRLDNHFRPKDAPELTSINKTRRLTTTALLCAAAYVSVLFLRVPVPPFLEYSPKDVFILFGGLLFGPMMAFGMTVVVCFLEMITTSASGPIGFLMNVISTASFVCVVSYIYKKRRTIGGAVLGLVVGVVFMTGIMLLWNYLIVPLYMLDPGGNPVSRQTVAGMLLPLFAPFNLLKGTVNAAIILILYRPLVAALRKIGMFPKPPVKRKVSFAGIAAALFVLGTCVLVFLLWQR